MPYINHFLQPDTIIPGPASPQSWNRYSYVLNNPINAADPSGHKCVGEPEECLNEKGKPITASGGYSGNSQSGGGSSGGGGNHDHNGGGGDNHCHNDDICLSLTTEEIVCDYVLSDCEAASNKLALLGTGLDGISFAINAPFGAAAVASLIAALLGDPAGLLAYATVVKAYAVAAPISTAFGWAGFGAWALQGLVTGENQLAINAIMDSEGSLKEISVSGSVAQDTLFSFLNDTLSSRTREPIVGTIWSGAGVAYDLARNPFDRSSPLLPTGIQPKGSISYNFQSSSFSFNGSWYSPGP